MKHDTVPVALISAMFLTIGVMFCMNDILLPIVKEHFDLTATFLTLYYVLAAVFALVGAWLLRMIQASTLLAIFGCGMLLCYGLVIWGPETIAPFALIGMGGFLSIMFPTVFGLAIENLKDFTEKGSALLNFAIVGGAVFPPLQGIVADNWNIDLSYLVPAICVIVVTAYGVNTRSATMRAKVSIKGKEY